MTEAFIDRGEGGFGLGGFCAYCRTEMLPTAKELFKFDVHGPVECLRDLTGPAFICFAHLVVFRDTKVMA